MDGANFVMLKQKACVMVIDKTRLKTPLPLDSPSRILSKITKTGGSEIVTITGRNKGIILLRTSCTPMLHVRSDGLVGGKSSRK
jgi:hypothetical protein